MERLDLSAEGVTLVVAGKKHARELARIMRPADVAEMRAAGGTVTEAIARASINLSLEAWAAYRGKDLLCVFGVRPLQNADAIWLLGSKHIDKYPFTFWKCSKKVMSHLRGKYPLMFNMIHGKYLPALNWVERLGFKLGPPEPFGPHGDLFCCAVIETKKVVLNV